MSSITITRLVLKRFYLAPLWRNTIGFVVLLNSIVLGAITEVPEGSALAGHLALMDSALLAILVLDVGLCIAVKRRAILKSGWDIFDISVTLISVLPNIGMLSALRVLRVIRVLRLISFVRHGRETVDALLTALRNMTAAFVILIVVFYSFVVIATNLFRDTDPDHYGNLGRSAAHLYSTMVSLGAGLEGETVFATMPWAYLLFGAFIVIAGFGLLNMFIAVLVAALKEQLEQEKIREERAHFARIERKIDELQAMIGDIRRAGAGGTTPEP